MSVRLAELQRASESPALLGLGTAALGRPGYITADHGKDLLGQTDIESMMTNALKVLDFAYQHGVRYFDTARSYGRAEEFLAEWLRTRSLSDVFVASKWGYEYVANWWIDVEEHEVKDHSLGMFQRQLVESTDLLGDHLGLYQIHSVTPQSPALMDPELLDRLAALKASGVAIGLSTSGPNQPEVLDAAGEINIDGGLLFDSVQVTWNLLEPSATESLLRLKDQGVFIVIKEALANGRLTSSGDHPATSSEVDATPDALALAIAMNQSPGDVVLSGAVNIAQLKSNLSSVKLPADAGTVGPSALDPIDYWGERSALPWT